MTSSKAKGRRVEKLCEKALLDLGYQVELASPKFIPVGPGRIISKSHDFFGVFDIIAFKTHCPPLLIQVTMSDKNIAEKKRKIEDFPVSDSTICQLWHYTGRGNVRQWIRLRQPHPAAPTWIERSGYIGARGIYLEGLS